MKKIKAIKNFKCNGVKKSPGQMLSQKDIDLIGEKQGQILLNEDMIMIEKEAPKKIGKKEPKKDKK